MADVTTQEASADSGQQQQQSAQPAASQAQQQPTGYRSPFDIYGEKGVIPEHLDKIDDKYKSTKNFLAKYNNMDALNQGIEHFGWMARQKGFERPAPDAPDSEKARFESTLRSVLGVPDSIEGYGIQRPDEISEEAWNSMGIDKYLEVAHKHGVPPAAFKELLDLDLASAKEAVEQQRLAAVEKSKQEMDGLVQKFGDRLPLVLQNAQKMADMVGFPKENLVDGDRVVNAQLVEAFSSMARLIGESALPANNQGAQQNGRTFQQQAEDIVTNPSNPFFADYHSGDNERMKRAVAEQTRLFELQAKQKKGLI